MLAPVLYLAHASGRVAPSGALIQGRDVNLIRGGDLVNVGTLRATNHLAASATKISNSGLIEAGGRLDMLATDSIRNAQGGISAAWAGCSRRVVIPGWTPVATCPSAAQSTFDHLLDGDITTLKRVVRGLGQVITIQDLQMSV